MTDAACYDPDEVIETLDMAATVAARQLVRAILAEAADDLRARLTRYDLDMGVEDAAADLIRVCTAYQNAGKELTESRAEFIANARRLAGVESPPLSPRIS